MMTHPGRAVDLQSASSCVACVDCIVWLLVHSEVVTVKHTPRLKHACRSFRRLERHLATLRSALVHSESSSPQSCHGITTLPYSYPRRCARRAHELSSFCTTLTTSGNSLTSHQQGRFQGVRIQSDSFTFKLWERFFDSMFNHSPLVFTFVTSRTCSLELLE